MKRYSISLTMLLITLAAAPALAMKNPAAVYCTALGYEYIVEKSAAGDVGYCILPGDQKVDAWQFLQGQVAQDKSYCASKGYRLKAVKDPKKCLTLMTGTCAVCVLGDGREVEVTELMNLILAETTCGDSVCGVPETHESCPADCPSGSADGYCDGIKDGTCDPDCTMKRDSDCRPRGTNE